MTGQAIALTNLGLVYLRQGRYQRASAELTNAVSLYRQLGHRFGEAAALTNLGQVRYRLGHYQQAAGDQARAVALAREIGSPRVEAWALTRLSEVRCRQGLHEQGPAVTGRPLSCSARPPTAMVKPRRSTAGGASTGSAPWTSTPAWVCPRPPTCPRSSPSPGSPGRSPHDLAEPDPAAGAEDGAPVAADGKSRDGNGAGQWHARPGRPGRAGIAGQRAAVSAQDSWAAPPCRAS